MIDISQIVSRFLGAADQAAPNCIEGLYLLGSVAFDDFVPGRSDLDLAILATDPGDAAAARAVEAGFRSIGGAIPAEGVLLGWDDLQQDPVTIPARPYYTAGGLQRAGRFMLDPIAWHTLARYAAAARGPKQTEASMWCDRTALYHWTRGNLATYWTEWHRDRKSLLSYAGLAALHPRVAEWGVLGVSRLLFTLATGNLTSKTGAGLHALETMPAQWRPILTECLRLRRGARHPPWAGSVWTRRTQALDYAAEAIVRGRLL